MKLEIRCDIKRCPNYRGKLLSPVVEPETGDLVIKVPPLCNCCRFWLITNE